MSVFTSPSDAFVGVSSNQKSPFFTQSRQDTYENDINEAKEFPFMEKERIQFPKGKQKEFIVQAKGLSKTSWKKAGSFFGINCNTFQTYWKERTRLSKRDFELICKALRLNFTDLVQKYGAETILWDSTKQLRGKSNGIFLKAKTKTIEGRMQFSNDKAQFDNSAVVFSNSDLRKKIVLPNELTPLLAEETGASIGDGFVSNKKFEYRLKGNKENENDYYVNFVKPMFKELYNVDVNIKEYEATVGFELYSQAIWEFKTKVVGLPIAPKTNIRIPPILKINNKDILSSLIRGLFDTDGSIYFRSQGKNKAYYPVLSITTISKNLAEDVITVLKILGFNPNIYVNSKITVRCPKIRYSVVLYGYSNFMLYKKLINTRQPKNIAKLKAWEEKFGGKLVEIV